MVAISLYRGNLHRVPDVPRRWLMPTTRFSLKDFRKLLHRRSKALSLLHPSAFASTSTSIPIYAADGIANPHPTSSPPSSHQAIPPPPPPQQQQRIQADLKPEKFDICSELLKIVKTEVKTELEDEKRADGGTSDLKPLNQPTRLIACKTEPEVMASDTAEGGAAGNVQALQAEKDKAPLVEEPDLEGHNKETLNEKEKRRREVEEKLQILNAKKHNLVQALKLILNAEEELKRRSSMQGMHPSLSQQVDVTTDSGSMTQHTTPRIGSEANIGRDLEGGEADDTSNHNLQSRQLLCVSSVSPSSESALRRPPYFQHNMAPLPSRTGTVAAASPSRFAHPGNQGQSSNLPTISVSGTSYVASSPSPAASGGTSAFRDSPAS
ncbi:hypothetical protein Ancab_038971 [Ancistrocladus abbreviatus]